LAHKVKPAPDRAGRHIHLAEMLRGVLDRPEFN
jgi:hypothetical protein